MPNVNVNCTNNVYLVYLFVRVGRLVVLFSFKMNSTIKVHKIVCVTEKKNWKNYVSKKECCYF